MFKKYLNGYLVPLNGKPGCLATTAKVCNKPTNSSAVAMVTLAIANSNNQVND